MKLMTKEIEAKFPALYENEEKTAEDTKIFAKFFTPWANWTWYATEYSPEDRLFFGYVSSPDGSELGYFSLDELESVKGPFGLKIERDLHFSGTLADVMEKEYA
jgi:hypothetical protein